MMRKLLLLGTALALFGCGGSNADRPDAKVGADAAADAAKIDVSGTPADATDIAPDLGKAERSDAAVDWAPDERTPDAADAATSEATTGRDTPVVDSAPADAPLAHDAADASGDGTRGETGNGADAEKLDRPIDVHADGGTTGRDAAGEVSTDTGEVGVPTLPTCLPAGYAGYFEENPAVTSATLGRLTTDQQAQLCADLAELERTGSLVVPEPAASVACVEPASCSSISLTDAERSRILVGKHAHAVWLDYRGKVPWRLADYTAADLDGLFAPSVLFFGVGGTRFRYVVDHSSSEAWAYIQAQKLVASSPRKSIEMVISDLRTTEDEYDFLHGSPSLGDPVDTPYTLREALTTYREGRPGIRVARKGCQSMSRIVLGLLRAMNVPGVEVHDGTWFYNGHSSATWPAFALVMPHGDDPYDAILYAAPTSALLVEESFYTDPSNVAVCGTDPGCLGDRHRVLTAIRYPPSYMTERCCDPAEYEYASCAGYLSENYGPCLTATEVAGAETVFRAGCP